MSRRRCFRVADFLEAPGLLGSLPPGVGVDPRSPRGHRVCDVEALTAPDGSEAAVAAVLDPTRPAGFGDGEDPAGLLGALDAAGAKRLAAVPERRFPPTDKRGRSVQQRLDAATRSLEEAREALAGVRVAAGSLLVPEAPALEAAWRDLREPAAEAGGADDPWLLADWVRRWIQAAGDAVRERVAAGEAGEARDAALAHADAGRWEELAAACGSEPTRRSGYGALRGSPTREAAERWCGGDAAGGDASVGGEGWSTLSEPGQRLLELWTRTWGRNPQTGKNLLAALVTAFGLRDDGLKPPRATQRFWVLTLPREPLARACAGCAFLPQAGALGDVKLLMPRLLGDLAQATPAALRERGDGGDATTTLLAWPGSEPVAAQAARSLPVFDAVDLRRVLQAGVEGGNAAGAFVEVLLEQLPLHRVNPFVVREGQHIHPQMFVGRRREVEQLLSEKPASRIFSGRRLGKTALLKHFEVGHGGRRLRDGRTLRVIRATLVGIDGEEQVVAKLGEALTDGGVLTRAQLKASGSDASASPARRLATLVEAATAGETPVRLMIVMDEADEFVLHQTRPGAAGPLSWAMREMESPRGNGSVAFFVVCGFRHTREEEGARGNRGPLLQLGPLEPDDAERLFCGPLARIGVDAATHAARVAAHCGNQPAPILQCGLRLLACLGQETAAGRRRPLRVTAGQIADVLHDEEVANELRNAVRLNFQTGPASGSGLEELVFHAALLVFRDAGPHAFVSELGRSCVDRLRACGGGDLGDALAPRVESALRKLRERALLVTAPGGGGEVLYRLRIPSQFLLLCGHDQEQRVAAMLRRFQEAEPGGGAPLLVGGAGEAGGAEPGLAELLDEAVGGDSVARAALAGELEAVALCRGVVATSLLPLVLHHRGCGLIARLLPGEAGGRVAAGDTAEALTAFAARVAAEEPAVLHGGLGLCRAVVADAVGERRHAGLDHLPLRRMHRRATLAWVERASGIVHTDSDHRRRMLDLVGGVPDLLRVYLEAVRGELGPEADAGGTLDAAAAAAVEAAFLREARAEVHRLYAGAAGGRFTAEEAEVLARVAGSSRVYAAIAESAEDVESVASQLPGRRDLLLAAAGASPLLGHAHAHAAATLVAAGFLEAPSPHPQRRSDLAVLRDDHLLVRFFAEEPA